MKSLKKILIIITMTMIFGTSAFAASGFEFIINAPLQIGVGIPPKFLKDSAKAKSETAFEYGVTAQFGHMMRISRSFGISLLAELGYAHNTFAMSINARAIGIEIDNNVSFYYGFENLQVGILPKLNFGAFSIGIGGGVKIPIEGKETIKIGSAKNSKKLNKSDIESILEPDIIGYIKGTFDYSIFLTDTFALNVGLYLGYDIIKAKMPIGDTKYYWGSFDAGVEVGLRFGQRA